MYDDKQFQMRIVGIGPKQSFNAADIGTVLGYTKIRDVVANLPDHMKMKIKVQTRGGLQTMQYLTESGVKHLVVKSRKQRAVEFAKSMDIDIYSIKLLDLECQTIGHILKAFAGEDMICQHRVGNYMIDLYFPKFNLAIECDEKRHLNYDKEDQERQQVITDTIQCRWVRYQPETCDIFDVINQIYRLIK